MLCPILDLSVSKGKLVSVEVFLPLNQVRRFLFMASQLQGHLLFQRAKFLGLTDVEKEDMRFPSTH